MSPPDPLLQEMDSIQSQWRIDDLQESEEQLGGLMDLQGELGNEAVSQLLEEGGGSGAALPGGPPASPDGGVPFADGGVAASDGGPQMSDGGPQWSEMPAAEEPLMSEMPTSEEPAAGDMSTADGRLMSEMPADPLMSQATAEPMTPAGPVEGGGGGAGGAGGAQGAGPDGGGGAQGAGPGVEPAPGPAVEAPEPAGTALEDTGASALSTGDLALIDEELSEHARWGAAFDEVGETASPERANFVANAVSSGMGDAAQQGALMAGAITGGTKLAERAAAKFVPIPAVGAILGGVMAGVGLWDTYQNWDAPGGAGESLGNIGEGASGYEVAANTIQGIVTILDLAANILDVLGGIAGVVSAACAIAILASFGILSPALGPVVVTATKIALTISVVTGIMNIIKMALQPMVVLFRALHSFYSEADPRDVQAQGAALTRAGSELGGTVGGLAAGMATEKAAGKLGDPPAPGAHLEGLDPSAPRDRGPEVEVDPTTGPRAAADPDGLTAPHDLSDADIDSAVSRLGPHDEAAPANPMHDVTDAEIDAALAAPGEVTSPMRDATEADIDSALASLDRPETIDAAFAFAGPVAPDGQRGGLVGMTIEGQNTNPSQIAYHENMYFEGISGAREIPHTLDADGHIVAPQFPSGPSPQLPPAQPGEMAAPQTTVREQGPSPGPNQPRPVIGTTTGGHVEVRYHSANPGAPPGSHSHDNPSVQVNTPSSRFPWADNQTVPPGHRTQVRNPPQHQGPPNTERYRTPEGQWLRIDEMTPEQIASAHYPVSGGPRGGGVPPGSGSPPPGSPGPPLGPGPGTGGSVPQPLFEGDIGPDVDRAFGAMQTDPRLLDPTIRHNFDGMESEGSEFNVGGAMARMADRAEAVGLGARTSAAKTMASAYNTSTAPSPPGTVTGSGLQPGAYGDIRGPEGATQEEMAELRAEAEVNAEPVNPQYPSPRCSEADLLRMEDDIEAALAERAQAEADAAEMEASAQVAEENQATAEAVAGQTQSVAGPAAQAHAALIARRQQRNQEQQQKLAQSQEQSMSASEEVGGTTTLITMLGIWSGFTGLMSYLPGSIGATFEEMQGEANTFILKLLEAKGLIEGEAQAGEPRLAESQANQGQIEATAAENEASQSTIGQAEADVSAVADQQGEQASEAHETAACFQAEADEAGTLAEDMAAEHESLAEELQAWAEEHKAARALAVEETRVRLEEQGYTVTQVCDW